MKIHELTTSMLTDGVHDQNIFHAVFMAGSPGSGKSTIARKLFAGTGLKELNVDNFWDLYHKMGKEKDYDHFYNLTVKQRSNWIDGRLGLLIDGTARNLDAIHKVKDELEVLGYQTAMVFVNTDLETSLQRVSKRAAEIERNVSADFVKDSWHSVQNNLGYLQQMFGMDFYIVDNSVNNPDLSFVQKKLRAWLNTPPHLPAAKSWLNQQQQSKAAK